MIVGSTVHSRVDGERIGWLCAFAWSRHGWRLLVVTHEGELYDTGIDAVLVMPPALPMAPDRVDYVARAQDDLRAHARAHAPAAPEGE